MKDPYIDGCTGGNDEHGLQRRAWARRLAHAEGVEMVT